MSNNNNLKTISVSGHVKSVVFQNDDNGYHVVKIITKQKKTVTITGVMSNIQEGLFIEATGHEINDPQYGEQVQTVEYVTTLPTNEDAMINFLSSNFTTGIGPVFARKIVDRFGANTFEVIDKTPEKLKNIAGLGKKKYLQLKEKWIEKKIFRDVYFFLHQHSITGSIALKIVSKFGQDTIGVLKENPYVLQTKLAGVGFKRADQLADKLGVDRLSPQRINAGIQHIIQTHADNGHTTIEKKQLLRETQDLLCCTSDIISTGYEQLVSEESVMVKTKTIEGEAHDYVSLSKYYFMEKSIATACMQFLTTQSIKKTGHVTSNDVQKCTPFLFSKKQVEAVILALTKKLTVITGGPGTGKSTITKAIVDIAHDRSMKVVCAAPTGKASKRLHSVTKHFSQTIHQLLELDFKTHRFKYNKEFKLDGDLFIIDEMSMVDTYLFYCLTQAIPHNARLILIGDIDQLPSIGPGNILSNLLDTTICTKIRLIDVYRQSQQSYISRAAHAINAGTVPEVPENATDFFFSEINHPDKIANTVLSLVSHRIPKYLNIHPLRDIQVLTPMHRGVTGIDNLNSKCQSFFQEGKQKISIGSKQFYLHDKVMQTRNNYQKHVFNGDVGFITSISTQSRTIQVTYEGSRVVEYKRSECDEIVLAYATSIHKFQGSECPCVIIPLHQTHAIMLQRNLLYTAVTRGKQMVVILGTLKAYQMAVRNNKQSIRHTLLIDQIVDRASSWKQLPC